MQHKTISDECRERKITNEKGNIGILYSIASRKKEPAYTSDIIQKLQEAKLIVVEGTLYPLLTRLKNSELLSYQWIEIYSRTASQVLPAHPEGRRISWRAGNILAGTE